jgi:nucleoside-diphosphate-sugar epimerase
MVRSADQASELEKLGAEVVVADLKDRTSLVAATAGVSSVIHTAALFRQAGLPESEFFAVNVEGTRALLDAAIAAGAQRFIHCSTVGVHGDVENPPANEDYPYNPGDMYQRSKAEGERLVRRYLAEQRIHGAVIRPAMIYGPHDSRTFKLFSMIGRRRFFYVGSGDALVHFVDVRDVARGFRLALDNQDVRNDVFIIGGSQALPLRTLVSEVCEILNIRRPWLHLPVKPLQLLGSACEMVCTPLRVPPPIYRRRVDFYTKNRSFDCSKARTILGYSAAQDLHGEIVDIVNSYIADGKLKGSPLSTPGTIIREVDGTISRLDNAAERLYGVVSGSVAGKVSHAVFRTTFPSPLEQINRELREKGRWIGNLIHSKSTGEQVSVFSCWELRRSEAGHELVYETNRLRLTSDSGPWDRSWKESIAASLTAAAVQLPLELFGALRRAQ